MACNRIVYILGPRSASEEATLELRCKLWMKEAGSFIKECCYEKGIQHKRNLSENAERGRSNIMIMVQRKETVVVPSDKGKGMRVIQMDMYMRMRQEQTKNDVEKDW